MIVGLYSKNIFGCHSSKQEFKLMKKYLNVLSLVCIGLFLSGCYCMEYVATIGKRGERYKEGSFHMTKNSPDTYQYQMESGYYVPGSGAGIVMARKAALIPVETRMCTEIIGDIPVHQFPPNWIDLCRADTAPDDIPVYGLVYPSQNEPFPSELFIFRNYFTSYYENIFYLCNPENMTMIEVVRFLRDGYSWNTWWAWPVRIPLFPVAFVGDTGIILFGLITLPYFLLK